ncbi:expressed unknown protein [Seminavis robusta]|uniref:Uncharacterized protein n=1 Tax=Seminavis robusta TaxID=568900 RepID=A0A9N8E931_9STRA|nr:expressed unknown protein [Seminavis robusta]|eukprot:Sro820_g207311.1  (140) ;mRNA; f:42881-43300
MAGILAYQGSTPIDLVEIVRFPISERDGMAFYHLEAHDTVTFACEDSTQELILDDVSLEPHDVNFYTYTWPRKPMKQDMDFSIPTHMCRDPRRTPIIEGSITALATRSTRHNHPTKINSCSNRGNQRRKWANTNLNCLA